MHRAERFLVAVCFLGAGPEADREVTYYTRGGRIIERTTTVRRFPGGGVQTEMRERDVGRDMGKVFCVMLASFLSRALDSKCG